SWRNIAETNAHVVQRRRGGAVRRTQERFVLHVTVAVELRQRGATREIRRRGAVGPDEVEWPSRIAAGGNLELQRRVGGSRCRTGWRRREGGRVISAGATGKSCDGRRREIGSRGSGTARRPDRNGKVRRATAATAAEEVQVHPRQLARERGSEGLSHPRRAVEA